ncbi:anhydro-N-acetylmuramic acid kinase [Salinimicrobium sp. GXAS 041]|uniref:anhydro-N-acetylmuramic acid kinase n=1 Tax=Salinimicrobium sp. GXAS 041 TaxID=3400806 RepID=UPI003C711319
MRKNEYFVLGVMSGTSLDGIDIAHLHFHYDETWNYKILAAETLAYPEDWKMTLSEAIFYDDERLHELNKRYTVYLSEVLSDFIAENKIKKIDAICSHGHTIKHEPENGFTLQIGNRPEVATLTGQKVVCDFRVQDVELGGQGAPLVPVGDELLFPEVQYCLNLGGFANVSTVLEGERIAFDICPVNTVLNYLAEKLDLPYDKNGEIAASGRTDEVLLEKLNSLPFYAQEPPKSLGIEWVNGNILPLLAGEKKIPDLLNTYAVHAGIQISRMFDQNPGSKVLVTGGGAFNGFLMEQIKMRAKNDIFVPASKVVNYKEALIFGFLGVLKLRNEVNVLKSVTGSSKDHSSGVIYEPQK